MLSENNRHEKVGENRAARKSRYHEMIQREWKKAQFARSIWSNASKAAKSDFKYNCKRIEVPYYSDILHYSS